MVRNTDAVHDVIAEKVRATDGRISAKRLLPMAQAAGYTGSARNFRRAVADAKQTWRRDRRVFRPWLPTPGEHLVIDWTTRAAGMCSARCWPGRVGGSCAFARDQKAVTTMGLLAECFEELGGVPKVVLTDRMGCLKGGVVANVVVPTADYVRFADALRVPPGLLRGRRPGDQGHGRSVVPVMCKTIWSFPPSVGTTSMTRTTRVGAWCVEVNTVEHSTIAAVPPDALGRGTRVVAAVAVAAATVAAW